MSREFIRNANLGQNKWWHYSLTIVTMVVFAAIFTLSASKIVVPFVRTHFEKTPFSVGLLQIVLVGFTFGAMLLGLSIGISKLHRRSFSSLIHADKGFSWRLWLMGFLMWCPLVFVGSLWTNNGDFQNFLNSSVTLTQVVILLVVGTLTIGIQATAEEIIFRGYFLQGLRLRIKRVPLLVGVNALIFALLHFGYGFQSLIETFAFGVIFALLVLKSGRIEFAAGAHTVNNLILLVFFPEGNDKLNAFKWEIDWLSLGLSLSLMLIFYLLSSSFVSKKNANA